MIGVVIGDLAGSRFERANQKSKDFELLPADARFTDDTVMSIAVADAILDADVNIDELAEDAEDAMQNFGRRYPDRGYGEKFMQWIESDDPTPYGSYGNGGAMRVSAAGWAANSLEHARELARRVTEVTHNNPEAMKGAEAVASAIYLARTGVDIDDIKSIIQTMYYPLGFTLDEIRDSYEFDVSAQGSVPQALEAFFESVDFEDAIRNAVSIGGDSDTIAAIAGSVAEAYYGVPRNLRSRAESMLDGTLLAALHRFEEKHGPFTSESGTFASEGEHISFEDFVKYADPVLLRQIGATRRLLGSYRAHIMDGLHEALDHKMNEVLDDVLDENWKELYVTLNHLLEDDPNVDDEATAAYGDMLAEANWDAQVKFLAFMSDHELGLKDRITEIIDDAVENFKECGFEGPWDSDEDEWIEVESDWEDDEEDDDDFDEESEIVYEIDD